MERNRDKKLLKTLRYYFAAHDEVIDKGYRSEILWQDSLDIHSVNTQTFYSEYAWVVLSSGMNEIVVRRVFPPLSEEFENWNDPLRISQEPNRYVRAGLSIFNHTGKIEALVWMAGYLASISLEDELNEIKMSGADVIRNYPYMGPATSLHFAKNIGVSVAKPDRHLVRIAEFLGYASPEKLCKTISDTIGEKESIIDLILWRYATINRNYLKQS